MKKLLFLCIFFCYELFADGAVGKCFIYNNGAVIAVWQEMEASQNSTIVGAIGTTSTLPSSWTQTTISSGISESANMKPLLFSNANGDVVVLWQFIDTNGNSCIAASLLPSGTSTWISSPISTSDCNSILFDYTASIDIHGNIMAIWTSTSDGMHTQAYGATAIMGTSPTWSTPFQINN
jgi:hypothetical protein